jgi:hypothetical protein
MLGQHHVEPCLVLMHRTETCQGPGSSHVLQTSDQLPGLFLYATSLFLFSMLFLFVSGQSVHKYASDQVHPTCISHIKVSSHLQMENFELFFLPFSPLPLTNTSPLSNPLVGCTPRCSHKLLLNLLPSLLPSSHTLFACYLFLLSLISS